MMDVSVFDEHESNVRFYCRSFPNVFHTAKGSLVYSEAGESYIDFFAGAGAFSDHREEDSRKGFIDHQASHRRLLKTELIDPPYALS